MNKIMQAEIEEAGCPIVLFEKWMAEAAAKGDGFANAMSLASVDENSAPQQRMVLLKAVDEGRFVFYTNMESPKARHLGGNGQASLLFHWKGLERHVRVSGSCVPVSRERVEAYFNTRERGSQIGAWASAQSEVLGSRGALVALFEKFEKEFEGKSIPTPPFWGGFQLSPLQIEFWLSRPARLHERVLYTRESVNNDWRVQFLFP